MNQDLLRRYREFRSLYARETGGIVQCRMALSLARDEQRAEREGLSVTWEDDDLPWDGEGSAPKIVAVATVYVPGCDGNSWRTAGWVPSTCPGVHRRADTLASLGGIGLDDWRDPYVREVEAELLGEALDELDAERDRAATAEASELAARPTFAGPCE
jgi:hypothetical protein